MEKCRTFLEKKLNLLVIIHSELAVERKNKKKIELGDEVI